VIKRVQSSAGVKKVVDNMNIGPVVLDTDFVLKQKVDSILTSEPMVRSRVKAGVVQLSGEIKRNDADKILKNINQLPVSRIENALMIK
jgi:hyperosmotically inducible periplasmic protein